MLSPSEVPCKWLHQQADWINSSFLLPVPMPWGRKQTSLQWGRLLSTAEVERNWWWVPDVLLGSALALAQARPSWLALKPVSLGSESLANCFWSVIVFWPSSPCWVDRWDKELIILILSAQISSYRPYSGPFRMGWAGEKDLSPCILFSSSFPNKGQYRIFSNATHVFSPKSTRPP